MKPDVSRTAPESEKPLPSEADRIVRGTRSRAATLMRRALVLALLVPALMSAELPDPAVSFAAPQGAAEAAEHSPRFRVLRVVDGDTAHLLIEGHDERVRFIGMNTPERDRCFFDEATRRATALLGGQDVALERDPTQGERDRFGRLLGFVFLPDGRNFAEVMIREGYAKEFTYHRKPYKYQAAFRAAEQEARQNRRGLWANCRGR